MPELPEVETLCRQLRQVVLGRPILNLEILDRKLDAGINPAGRSVTDIRRVGKGVDITLTGGLALKIHLRMSGRLYWQEQYHIILPHTRFVITFPHGIISCVDPRRFATLSLVKIDLKPALVDDSLLGFNPIKLWNAAKRRKLPIKSFLLDQRVIGGVGNIYACEILHEAAIHPQRGADTLSMAEWHHLENITIDILRRAIACRGTTLSDWRDLFGRKGEYQTCLKVYGQEGRCCPRCGSVIRRKPCKAGGHTSAPLARDQSKDDPLPGYGHFFQGYILPRQFQAFLNDNREPLATGDIHDKNRYAFYIIFLKNPCKAFNICFGVIKLRTADKYDSAGKKVLMKMGISYRSAICSNQEISALEKGRRGGEGRTGHGSGQRGEERES